VGGHSVEDAEFKYGLSVTGLVHPDRVLTNAGARINDRLVLTKPIGTGILATAVKGRLASATVVANLIAVASGLNKSAAELMGRFAPSACTDVTGFGLAGHIFEMAAAARVSITLYADMIPLIDDVLAFARMGMFPAGAYNNRKHFELGVTIAPTVDPVIADLLFDPQTSGGLIISLNHAVADDCMNALHDRGISARMIGEVSDRNACGHVTIQ
jgi:selenide,water dikinase